MEHWVPVYWTFRYMEKILNTYLVVHSRYVSRFSSGPVNPCIPLNQLPFSEDQLFVMSHVTFHSIFFLAVFELMRVYFFTPLRHWPLVVYGAVLAVLDTHTVNMLIYYLTSDILFLYTTSDVLSFQNMAILQFPSRPVFLSIQKRIYYKTIGVAFLGLYFRTR